VACRLAARVWGFLVGAVAAGGECQREEAAERAEESQGLAALGAGGKLVLGALGERPYGAGGSLLPLW